MKNMEYKSDNRSLFLRRKDDCTVMIVELNLSCPKIVLHE